MGKYVDELSERIANVEAPHSPRLIRGPILDWPARISHSVESGVDIIDFDGKGQAFAFQIHLAMQS